MSAEQETILDDYGTTLEICAVNESDDNNFIDLQLLIPYQLNAEIYCEKGYSFDEKIRKINTFLNLPKKIKIFIIIRKLHLHLYIFHFSI